ncbi:GNAT family N-acetyltransferase [Rhodobacter capsulatus]|uniref:Acetyltransferase, GNAT family n=1 Tax=Rhodobacter capsulatus (strain ATCC BAA-309 / NBRC 16581 / SB1003) TaxID=272942 RepID=D5AL37_RHOCB|nr:GNAT family N-acetyltransferase [Rhodobacter capsulatus]ADE86027.1 acetyltransferase, GNAT family [Rhodobacter capsulatus SB 1003]ETD01121.1 GNAT family acetyltransferase [Rhodobacter capsulatus DE442]ETD75706.1 GNAT family acetyltransferase [Rhodobacter capsulatus R121]ETE53338.1 GNAT family acetyltransferase [Rhodobacter capsulatus Y262]MDS0926857.1 GNAT family N-acetyltransferase [Rhodobacter capsulatus]
MSLPAHLATDRLALRPLAAEDEAACVAALSDFEVVRWLAPVPWPYGAGDFRAFLADPVPAARWVICRDDAFLGMIGLQGQFGYWLARPAWGQGFASEAARAVLAAHFRSAAAEPVRAGYFEGNARSARVLAKLGFREIGRSRVPSLALDAILPHVELKLSRAAFDAACAG